MRAFIHAVACRLDNEVSSSSLIGRLGQRDSAYQPGFEGLCRRFADDACARRRVDLVEQAVGDGDLPE